MTNDFDVDEITIEQVRQARGEGAADLSWVREQIHLLDLDLRSMFLRKAVSNAAMALNGNPGWDLLQNQIKQQDRDTIEVLRTLPDPQPHLVVKIQAYLRSLRLMTLDPMSPDDLAELEHDASMHQRKIDDLRKLLPNRGKR